MAEQRTSGANPLSSWRDWMSQSENQLNTLFNELMATDGYGRLMGLVTKLGVSMQKSMTENMERYFTALSLPTRSDVIDLAQRLSTIETRLLAIETNLRKLTGSTAIDASPIVPSIRPPRTKKPAASKGGAQ
jgi:hypothetical protein